MAFFSAFYGMHLDSFRIDPGQNEPALAEKYLV
jgi:hypothetical protein